MFGLIVIQLMYISHSFRKNDFGLNSYNKKYPCATGILEQKILNTLFREYQLFDGSILIGIKS